MAGQFKTILETKRTVNGFFIFFVQRIENGYRNEIKWKINLHVASQTLGPDLVHKPDPVTKGVKYEV